MKNNLRKISLKPVLMSFLILLGTSAVFNTKIACASFDSQNGSSEKSSKDNNVNDSTSNGEISEENVFSKAMNLYFSDQLNEILHPKEIEEITIPDDIKKTIIDLANSNNNKE